MYHSLDPRHDRARNESKIGMILIEQRYCVSPLLREKEKVVKLNYISTPSTINDLNNLISITINFTRLSRPGVSVLDGPNIAFEIARQLRKRWGVFQKFFTKSERDRSH